MEVVDLPLAIEALFYDTEIIKINKCIERYHYIMRDTFHRKCMKDIEGVGSIFEGIECGFCFRTHNIPDEDYVCNLTEFTVNCLEGSLEGREKINIETDLEIVPCPNFPGYVQVKLLKPIVFWNKLREPISISDFLYNNIVDDCLKYGIEDLNVQIKKNGPALTRYSDTGNNVISKVDNVVCLAYKAWPVEANKWVIRNKPNNWPSKELIERIKSKGFNLAPVGHCDCSEKDSQWRIGIWGERELFSNLNETQILSYVALRLILKDDIQMIDKDVLSSYHMKNIIFWCAEQDSCEWTKENFNICLKTCIDRLIQFIDEERFPHYFIEDRNLINSKMTSGLKRQIVESLIKYRSDVLTILSLRSFDELKKLTNNFNNTWLKCEKQKLIIKTYMMFNASRLQDIFLEQNTLWETFEGHNTAVNVQNAQFILSFLQNIKRQFILPYIAYAKNMLGLLYYSRYHETRCSDYSFKATQLLTSSVILEQCAVKFRVANFYFMEKELKECLRVCNDFFNNPSKYKTKEEKSQHFWTVSNVDVLIESRRESQTKLTNLTKLKQKISANFYDECISENCGDARLLEAKQILSEIVIFGQKMKSALKGDELNQIILDFYSNNGEKSYDKFLIMCSNLQNLILCDMSFNVPFLASEKWAVPDVIQYELLSVKECHPGCSIYGIYIDPMLNCLVLSFLSYNETNNLTQRDEMLMKMAEYIKEYSNNGQPVSAELPYSLPRYRVYNIVAYCLIKAERYQWALEYILESFYLHKNAENAAYGYIRCVRLFGKEHIMSAIFPDVVLADEIFEKFAVDLD